jgi:hypothetical protein
MAANEIMKTGKLNPGDGNHGKGIYFTSMNPYLFSKDEIKLLLRNTKISDECISANIGIDTDDLDKKGIKYVVKPNNTVFIPTETPLDIKGIAKRDDTPLEKAE